MRKYGALAALYRRLFAKNISKCAHFRIGKAFGELHSTNQTNREAFFHKQAVLLWKGGMTITVVH
jgi:hypothetical protein